MFVTDDFATKMDHLLAHPEEMAKCGKAAGNYVMSKAGATEKVLNGISL